MSHYPYADGDQATTLGSSFGLENLTSAARSASEMAAWLLTEYHNDDAPLGSLHVCLSPVAGERIHDVVQLVPRESAATRSAVERDLGAFRNLCQESRENVGFVYVAGHGVQLSKRGAIVLLHDFGASQHLNELSGAIDMVGCHAGLNSNTAARNQFWFVDACRQRPAIASRFEELAGALTLSRANSGDADSSPLFLASSSREAALAEVSGTSLFNQAVLWALRGAGSTGPNELCPSWHVPVSGMVGLLDRRVKTLAGIYGEEQRVDITGRVNEAVMQRMRGAPDVEFAMTLTPEDAAPLTTASLTFENRQVIRDSNTWPFHQMVPAGLYVLEVASREPYRPHQLVPLNLTAPTFHHSVAVT